MLIPEDIEFLAYKEIFNSAESMLEDWIDEAGDYTEEEFEKIFNKSFELLHKLRETYL